MISSWISAFRFPTLAALIVPVCFGGGLSFLKKGELNLFLFCAALFFGVFIQLATNLFNDVFDFRKGLDGKRRLGFPRAVSSGKLSEKQVLRVAFFCLFIAFLFSIPITLTTSGKFLLLELFALYLAYGYTSGRLSLCYKGLAEIFCFLFFGLIPAVGTFYLQTGYFCYEIFILGAQAGFLSLIFLTINNLRDFSEDSYFGKRTLIVRIGEKWGRAFFASLFVFVYFLGFFLPSEIFFKYAMMCLWTLPLSLFLLWKILFSPPSQDYNRCFHLAIILSFAFAFTFFLF